MDPGYVARQDQTRAAYDHLLEVLRQVHAEVAQEIEETGTVDNDRANERVIGAIDELLPEEDHLIDFTMYAIGLLNSALGRLAKHSLLAEAMLRGVAYMLRPDHPAKEYENFDPPPEMLEMVFERLRKDFFSDRPDEREEFVTGTGQKLTSVHPRGQCRTEFCVIHNPCPGPWDTWKTHWRGDNPFDLWRGFERICPCGVGHPAVEEYMRTPAQPLSHGCCGECPCGPWNCDEIRDPEGKLLGFSVKGQWI